MSYTRVFKTPHVRALIFILCLGLHSWVIAALVDGPSFYAETQPQSPKGSVHPQQSMALRLTQPPTRKTQKTDTAPHESIAQTVPPKATNSSPKPTIHAIRPAPEPTQQKQNGKLEKPETRQDSQVSTTPPPTDTTQANNVLVQQTKTLETNTATAQAQPEPAPLPVIRQPGFSQPPQAPNYPKLARKRGQEGVVWLAVELDKQGQQVALSISKSSGYASLDKAAMNAVAKWRFIPHRENNTAMAARVVIPVQFSLNSRES